MKTTDDKVMNVTPHITCGAYQDFHFIVKNYTSPIDVHYKIPNEMGETNTLPILDKNEPSSSMPQITINGTTKEFTFNNIIPCKTPNGTLFITAIDICLDHARGVAKKNYSALIKKDSTILKQPISHVVVSNCTSLNEENCIGRGIMHVDPHDSPSECKNGFSQQASALQKSIFGKDLFKIFDVAPQQINKFINTINNYAYKTTDPSVGRNHGFYRVTLDKVKFKKSQDLTKFQAFKEKYQAYTGEYLKNKILEDLKERIEDTTSLKELDDLKKELKTSFEYKVLKTGQGWFTQTFRIKTSAQKALDNMIEQQKEHLSLFGLKY